MHHCINVIGCKTITTINNNFHLALKLDRLAGRLQIQSICLLNLYRPTEEFLGPHVRILLTIYVLYSNVNEIIFLSCLVEINWRHTCVR